jgi:glucokinase
MLLAADIGGTNARLGLFEPATRRRVAVEVFPTADRDAAADVARELLRRHPVRLASACFAVAGPVQDGRSSPVNLRWTVDARELSAALGVPVSVVNDLEANARGIAVLAEHDVAVVNPGRAVSKGTRAVVSAGTGLGEAALLWDGGRYRALASEGGHTDFAPRTELEVELYTFLAAEYGHVSYERVCSGGGLVNLYRFLRGSDLPATTPAEIVAEAAADRRSVASRALGLFASIYGARAGNVALAYTATGGVYLGGGIAPRIVNRLTDGAFMRAFTAKGRLSALLGQIPVRIVLDDRAALLGAAEIAAEVASTCTVLRAA